jgi:serine O-acetyltransferase
VRVEGRRPEGPDADWVHLPDPIADALKGLANRIAALEGGPDADTQGNGAEFSSSSTLGPNPAGG